MKNLLLHLHDDDALESRFQVALDLARVHDAHLTLCHAIPVQDYVVSEPMSGFYPAADLIVELNDQAEKLRLRMAERLKAEDVSWDWISSNSAATDALFRASALADLLIVSQYPGPDGLQIRPLPVVDSLAVRTSCAMLVVPHGKSLPQLDGGPVTIGWNGSVEAAHAVRQAMPLLARASHVDIVAIDADEGEYPQEAVAQYLSRHGIACELHLRARQESTAASLMAAARELSASALLIGAYSHSRLREAIMGGVSRDLMEQSEIPLIVGH